MMPRRRSELLADLSQWPTVDASALTEPRRARFDQLTQAIIHYVDGQPLTRIEEQTGVGRRQLYRSLDRCLDTHADGRIWGWRALSPQVRTTQYQRTKKPILADDGQTGLTGAFGQLLRQHPALNQWIRRQVRQRRISIHQISSDGRLRTRLRGLKDLHRDFIGQCRHQGITGSDYPFNTRRLAVRSLSAYVKTVCLEQFERASRLSGATHMKGMARDSVPAATEPLQVVEFDGHRLDLRLKLVARDPLGYEHAFEIERAWLLAIIDVHTRAVLGYHMSLNREYSRHDVIRTVEAALEPHRPVQFTLPGLSYGNGGFPSSQFPEMAYATWQWFKLDNAKANLAGDVRAVLTDFVGCFVDAGPTHQPDDRPYVERFFRTISDKLSSRLPGYTGSHPKDLRRALADPKGDMRLVVSIDELDQLLEAAIGQYNGSPHQGLNGRSPLQAMEGAIRGRSAMLQWLPDSKRRTLYLMHEPRRTTVRGYLNQGQRPHVNLFGVRYTNEVLACSTAFIGQSLRLYYSPNDLRTVRAFTDEGAELGILKAQGAWGIVAHDLKLRKEVVKLRGRKQLSEALSADFLNQFITEKFNRAKSARRAASNLAQTLRTIDQGPLVTADPVPSHPSQTNPSVNKSVPQPTRARRKVKPQALTIGTGYIGTL